MGRGPAPLICCQDSGLPVTLVGLGLNHLAVVKDSLKSWGLLGGRPGREPVYPLVLPVSPTTKLLTVTNPDGVEKAG